jgi:flagellar biosynthesis protein FlhF
MQIKRFEARTMTAALKMVKDEFGVDAVILSARTLRQSGGFFGAGRSAGVEVTAAQDSGGSVYPAAGRTIVDLPERVLPSQAAEPSLRRGWFQSLNAGLRSLALRRGSPAPSVSAEASAPELVRLHHHLLAQEVARERAGAVIEHIQRLPGFDPLLEPHALRSLAGAVLHDLGLRHAAEAPEPGSPRITVLAGPCGAGKTTTAVKLAATQALRAGRRVALLTLDDQRIGAVEQMRIYASILGVPAAVATSAAEVQQAVQAFQEMDGLIVDTPGVSPPEEPRLGEMRQMLEPLKAKKVHLVLNACTREKDLVRVIECWKGLPLNALAFTRLDEAGGCGHLINLLLQTRLPLSYLGTGPRIPEDLAPRPLELLLRRIWPAGDAAPADRSAPAGPERAAGPPPDGVRFVANGSSALYHRPDCKWVRKIKPEHWLAFGSATEAEARQFTACRNCTPHRAEAETAARDAVCRAGGR